MKPNGLWLMLGFWLLVFADCLLIINHLDEYRYYTKSLIVPFLLVGIYLASKDTKHKNSRVLINLAFLFCFIGDLVLLDDSNPSFFVGGLLSFMTAHIFFIIFFYRLKKFTDKYRLYIFLTAAIILIYVGLLMFTIWATVSRQSLQIPVVIYALVLAFMLLTAFHTRYNKSMKKLSLSHFIPGAILFVLSDSLLAFNKFALSFEYAGVAVMLTYAGAIFLLGTGAIRFLSK